MKTLYALPILALLFSGCLIDGPVIRRNRTTDNRQVNITINEATGEAFYRDADGWTWLLDKFGQVIDGPWDLTGEKDPTEPKPTAPNPPPPAAAFAPIESGSWWVLLLLPALLASKGCLAIGDHARVQMFERADVELAAALSIGSRTQASSAASKQGADAKSESLTEGGGSFVVDKPEKDK